jgi:hypothetical protein
MEARRAGCVLRLALALIGPAALCHGQCEVLKLTGPLPDPAGDQFGFWVAVDGERMAVGKPAAKQGYAGSVDLLERQAGGAAWVLLETLVPSDGEEYDQFGYSVAIEGQTVVVEPRAPSAGGVPPTSSSGRTTARGWRGPSCRRRTRPGSSAGRSTSTGIGSPWAPRA